jgi:hypothetical protein
VVVMGGGGIMGNTMFRWRLLLLRFEGIFAREVVDVVGVMGAVRILVLVVLVLRPADDDGLFATIVILEHEGLGGGV